MANKTRYIPRRNLRVRLNQKERERRHTHLVCGIFLIVSIILSVFILLGSQHPFDGQITGFTVLADYSDAVLSANLDTSNTTVDLLDDIGVTSAETLLSASETSLVEPPSGEFTRGDAELAISDAKTAIEEMKFYSLPTKFVEDQLALAEKDLKYADYADIISRNEDHSEVQEAKEILKPFGNQDFNYVDVLEHTNNIKAHAESGILLIDAYAVVEAKKTRYGSVSEAFLSNNSKSSKGLINAFSVFGIDLRKYSDKGIDISAGETLIKESRIAFQEDRYDQAKSLLNQANSELDKSKAEYTVGKAISEGGKGFIRANWSQFLIIISILALMITFAGLQYKSFSMKNNLEFLKTEKKTLMELMKKTQKEHFVDKKLPLSVYKARMERYNTRQREIESQIPVLDAAINKKKVKGVIKNPNHKFRLKIK